VVAQFTRSVTINTAQLSEHLQVAPVNALSAGLGETVDPAEGEERGVAIVCQLDTSQYLKY